MEDRKTAEDIFPPDDPIVTNAKGGKGSKIYGTMSEVPPVGFREVARVMAEGVVKYPREDDGSPNWHKVGCIEEVDHALEHALNFLELRNEPYMIHDSDGALTPEARMQLSHAATRMVMALEQLIRGEM